MKHRKLFYFICIFTIFSNSYLLCGDNDEAHGFMTDKQFQKIYQWLNKNRGAFQVNNNTNYTQQVGDGAFVLPPNSEYDKAFKAFLESQNSWLTFGKKGLADAISQGGGNAISYVLIGGLDWAKNYILGPKKEEQLEIFIAEGNALTGELIRLTHILNEMPGAEDDKDLEKIRKRIIKRMVKRMEEYEDIHKNMAKSKPVETKQAMDKVTLEKDGESLSENLK